MLGLIMRLRIVARQHPRGHRCLQGLGPHRWGSATLMCGRRPVGRPRVLAVIATSLVGGVVCGSLIGWFLRSIRCSGRAWLLGSSLTMLRSRLAAIENKAAVGWLRRAGSGLVGAEA